MLFFETGLTALLAGTGVPVGFGTGLGGAVQEQWSTAHRIARGEHATPRHARTAPAVVLCGVASCRAGTPSNSNPLGGPFRVALGRAGGQAAEARPPGERSKGEGNDGSSRCTARHGGCVCVAGWSAAGIMPRCPAPLLRSLAKAWNWGRDENRARIRCFPEARSAHLLRPDRCLSAANTTCGTSRSSFLDLWWTAARLASTSGGTHSHGLPCWCGEPATTLVDGHRGMATGWEQA